MNENNQTESVQDPGSESSETTEATTKEETSTDKPTTEAPATEGTEVKEEPTATEGQTADTHLNDVDSETTDVLFIEPYDSTTYEAFNNDAIAYEIDLVHVVTLGDVLLATLLSILIIVVLLSRLLGRSPKW